MNDILTVRDLSVHFRQGKRLVQLVDRVSFSVARGECLGILDSVVKLCLPTKICI